MADYLTRLVERTLGLAPAVRPDIPPFFAPQESEPAPHDVLGVEPPPEPGRAGVAAREADRGPDLVSRFETPASAVAGPPDGGAGEPARTDPPVPENTDDIRRFDRRSTGRGADEEGPSGDPGQPVRGSDPTDVPAVHGSPGAERFAVVENSEERRGASSSASSDEPPERLSGRYEPRSVFDGTRDTPSRSSSRAGLRPGAGIRAASDLEAVKEDPGVGRSMIPTGRGEAASQGRRVAGPAGAVEGVAPLAGGIAPDRRRAPDRELTSVPNGLVPESGGNPGRAPGREDPVGPPDPAAGPRARRPAKPAAPEPEERNPSPPRRVVPEVPLVPATNRRRATTRAREVGEETSSPTVRVTIGRVEVRAVVPEPAPPPQPPATREPALSLDDYLEQHAGGRR